MKKYRIHFVCQGNAYRSRLAEAYVAAQHKSAIAASSSGVDIASNPSSNIMSYTSHVAEQNDLSAYLSAHKTQTTNKLLASADIVVFMNRDVYETAVREYDVNLYKCVVWDVDDVGVRQTLQPKASRNEIAVATYGYIKEKVDALLQDAFATSWADVVDEQNRPLGFRLPVTWIINKGLWRRGCHLVLMTTDGQFVVEKRTHSIVFSPDRLDITLGGGVDDGEAPEAGVIRECKEELGVTLAVRDLRLLEIYKWGSYHPHYKKRTRCFLYTYAATVDPARLRLKVQEKEVAAVRLLSERQIKRLLLKHRLAHFGRLVSAYAYYRRIVALAQSGFSSAILRP